MLLFCGCQSSQGAIVNHSSNPIVQVRGTVWQIDNQTLYPHGNWDKLGASELLIQWTAVDGISYLPGGAGPTAAQLPDWQRIADEPWAKNVIVGLAGRFDETTARANIAALVAQSIDLAKLPMPFHVVGWYFPLEIDPTWSDARLLAASLDALPRPLWISVYDSANVGAHALAQSLASWLPKDVGILFQDGVGIYARDPGVARKYADELVTYFGEKRVRIIAEAFRPQQGGGFRPATAQEIRPQLAAYVGFPVYLFEGPHYVNCHLVNQLIGSESTHC